MESDEPRLKILVSAYLCQPHRGSEPGAGWSVVTHLAKYHDVHVLTSSCQKPAIERELSIRPISGVTFHYHGIGSYRTLHGMRRQIHGCIWSLTAIIPARRLHRQHRFDLTQQVTLARYWWPNALAFLGIPFIFGPVSGADVTPREFLRTLPLKTRLSESFRIAVKRLAEKNPLLAAAVRRSALCIGFSTPATLALKRIGAPRVDTIFGIALSDDLIATLSQAEPPPPDPFRVISIARLVPWKGIDLGLRAFKAANLPAQAEYWIFGDGQEQGALERLAAELGISQQVRFFNRAARPMVMDHLSRAHVFLHPAFREARTWTCLEAMAAGKPIICLNEPGFAHPVPDSAGYKIAPTTAEEVVVAMAKRLRELSDEPKKGLPMGAAGRQFVRENLTWHHHIRRLLQVYRDVLQAPQDQTWPEHRQRVTS